MKTHAAPQVLLVFVVLFAMTSWSARGEEVLGRIPITPRIDRGILLAAGQRIDPPFEFVAAYQLSPDTVWREVYANGIRVWSTSPPSTRESRLAVLTPLQRRRFDLTIDAQNAGGFALERGETRTQANQRIVEYLHGLPQDVDSAKIDSRGDARVFWKGETLGSLVSPILQTGPYVEPVKRQGGRRYGLMPYPMQMVFEWLREDGVVVLSAGYCSAAPWRERDHYVSAFDSLRHGYDVRLSKTVKSGMQSQFRKASTR